MATNSLRYAIGERVQLPEPKAPLVPTREHHGRRLIPPEKRRRARQWWHGQADGIDPRCCKIYAYSMRETLTVSLPPRTKRLIARAATESGLTTSEYVRMAIHRKLWQDAVAESRHLAVPRARAKGIFTDEDVFALIS